MRGSTTGRITSILDKLEATQPFTEDQAWGLYRIVALSEAGGWTLLIGGLLIRHYGLPGQGIAVPVAGQIHGMIFLAYFGVLLVIYSSLGWPRRRFLVALLAGVPPYGSLLFEQWAAHARRSEFRQIHFHSIALAALSAKL